jgi:hypothetical protein
LRELGTYADDCLLERVDAHKCYILATCDRELKVWRTLSLCGSPSVLTLLLVPVASYSKDSRRTNHVYTKQVKHIQKFDVAFPFLKYFSQTVYC